MKTRLELEREIKQAQEALLKLEFKDGFEQGLAIARTIRNWLTREPDRAWQKQVREWADKEIENARLKLNNL